MPGDGENWAWQDLDGNVHIQSSLYQAEISAETGAVNFYGPNGQFLVLMDCVVVDSTLAQITRTGWPAVITLAVDGDTATVTLTQSAPEVTFTTTFDCDHYEGLVRCHEGLTYAQDRWIREEKLILRDQRAMYQDDDGENDYLFAYIDGTKRQRKEFELPQVPSNARIQAYVGWREDNGDSRFDSTLVMSVNGHDYDLTPLLTFPETGAGPTNWIDKSIDPAHLQVGTNQVTFRIDPRIGTEHTYLGLDMDTDHDRSAFSSNNGQTWSYDDLSPSSGQQNGEYMVRLPTGTTYTSDLVEWWDGSRNVFAVNTAPSMGQYPPRMDGPGNPPVVSPVPYMTRYSPRIARSGFTVSDTKLSLYGSRLGASGIEGLGFDGASFVAYLYNQSYNGIDCVVDPVTGVILDPVRYTEYPFNNAARPTGAVSEATLTLVFEEQHPSLLVARSRWPRNYKAAWTLGDDTDLSTASTKRAAYYGTKNVDSPEYGQKGFVGHNLKTTVTTWWQSGPYGILNNYDHRAVMTNLYNRGFEVGLHTATEWADDRTTTANALAAFLSLYDTYNWIEHKPYSCQNPSYCNREDILCWGKVASDPTYYLVDILEASPIKYLAQASNNMLFGAPNGLFSSPRCLPHYSSYVDDGGSSKRLMVYGRYGTKWDRCILSSKIDDLISRHELFVAYTHTGWTDEGWIDQSGDHIRDEVESHLVHLANLQDAGDLWVEPIYRIFDWMVDLENVTITQQSSVGAQFQASVTNALDEPVSGVTLIATDTIAEATIDGTHQIYVDGPSVVLPELQPSETKTIVITAGAYLPSIPRLTKVDTDVKVLKAEYATDLNSATIRAVWTGAGLWQNRRFAVACGDWRCLLARHGDLLFATVSRGEVTGSDPAYEVDYDEETGILSFTIPSLIGEQDITLRPCKDQSIDVDFDQDLDVDLEDFGHFQACLSGPDIPQTDPACQDALLDADTDVDVDDLALFDDCYSGPHILARLDCTMR